MSEQLKPCPFCGKQPEASLEKHCGTIACATTDCAHVEVERGQSTEAVRVWNRRAPSPDIAALARVAELERELEAHRRLRANVYRDWCSAGGRVADQCKHGVDTTRFNCHGCDEAVVRAALSPSAPAKGEVKP